MKFLKKLFKEKPKEREREKEREKLNYKDISKWIIKEQNKIEGEEREVSKEIKEKISFFTEDLRKKIEIVEDFNLDLKKADDRLKSICNEGRNKYIGFLEDFIDKLNRIDKHELLETENTIDKLFFDFAKISEKNYQKATILIGKEMASIRQTIKKFSEELLEIFKSNNNLIISRKRVLSIKESLKEIQDIENKIDKNSKEIKVDEKRIVEKKEENEEILSRITEIRKSKEYSENIERKKEIKEDKEKIEKKIFQLKQEINFKELARFYHVFEDKMKIVKEFREDFQDLLKKEEGEKKLIQLLDGANLNSENISKRLKEIQKMKKETIKKREEISEDKTIKLNSNSEMLISGIEDLEREITAQKKNIENFESNKEELREKIKEELLALDVELKD